MKPSFSTRFPDQRVIGDRRSRPTSFISTLRFGGRRKGFRRKGEGRNRYLDRLSFHSFALTFLICILSTLDANLTLIHLQNGGSELNPLMRQIIQTGFQPFIIVKSFGIGLMACFLAIHQNFRISFYGMHVLTAIYSVLLAYHLASTYFLLAT